MLNKSIIRCSLVSVTTSSHCPLPWKTKILPGFFLGVSGVVDLDDIEYVCDVATDDFRCVVGRGSVEAALTDVFVAILGLVIDDMRLEARRPESVWFAAVSSWVLFKNVKNCGKPKSPDVLSPGRPF